MTVLAQHTRRAAHGRHVCHLCHRHIAARERHDDTRCAYDGRAYTLRAHLDCLDAWHSWQPDDEESYLLSDLSDGHLPPCPLAWPDPPIGKHCTCTAAEPAHPQENP